MAEVNPKVMEMVEKRLEKEPEVSNRTLYDAATGVDASIGDLTLRQFHARYPLQVKRRKAQEKGGTAGNRKRKKTTKKKPTRRTRSSTPTTAEASRGAVREVLLSFARDVSAAEGKAAVIDLVAGVERYVDRVLKAVDGGR